jgi:hypothetical protein
VASVDKDKVVQQIRRLTIASDSFQQCVSLLAHMESSGLTNNNDLYPPMIVGVTVTYAKNFNQTDGLGPLPDSFARFPTADLQTAHSKLIKARNELYAHRDIGAHLFKDDEGRSVAYPVEVIVNDENTTFLFRPKLIDIPVARLPQIKELIQFQMKRLQDDLDGKLAATVDFDKGYKRGVVYMLGEDFP